MPAGEPRERELKLGVTPEDARRLLASPLLGRCRAGPVRSERLLGVYYDTADVRLRRRGLALRVRRAGRRIVQTLKTESRPEGVVKDRGEWEVALATPAPDLQAFADPRVLELAGLVLPDELAPVFETEVRRRSLMVRWPDGEGTALVEVAYDLGRVRAGGREAPISELELELKEGSAEALFGLARALREVAPLRLGALDKAARGWLLAGDLPPPWQKSTPPGLHRSLRLEEGMAAILGGCIAQALHNEAAAADGRQLEGVHQFRVALRRLRSAFALFRPVLPAAEVLRWTGEIRWLVDCLGRTRDLDVLLAELLKPLLALRPEDRGLLALRDAALARREAAQAAVRDALASPRAGDLLLELAGWVELRGWRAGIDAAALRKQDRPITGRAARILDRCHGRVLKRGQGFAGLDPEGRHALRIAFKRLRYGVEFFQSLFPAKRVGPYLAAARRMQDRLGQANDVVVAERLVGEILEGVGDPAARAAAALGGGQLIGWHAHALAALEPPTLGAWEEFASLDPFWRRGRRK